MGDRTPKIMVVVLVLAAGFVSRVAHEQVFNPSTPALAQEDQYDCARHPAATHPLHPRRTSKTTSPSGDETTT
jgi:hypothetical protein